MVTIRRGCIHEDCNRLANKVFVTKSKYRLHGPVCQYNPAFRIYTDDCIGGAVDCIAMSCFAELKLGLNGLASCYFLAKLGCFLLDEFFLTCAQGPDLVKVLNPLGDILKSAADTCFFVISIKGPSLASTQRTLPSGRRMRYSEALTEFIL